MLILVKCLLRSSHRLNNIIINIIIIRSTGYPASKIYFWPPNTSRHDKYEKNYRRKESSTSKLCTSHYVNTHQSKEPVTCFCVISQMKIALPNLILYNVIWHDIFCIIVDTQILHSAQRSIYKNKTILMSNQSAINYFHYTKYLNKIVYIWYCEISQSCLHRSLKICLMLNITKWHQ